MACEEVNILTLAMAKKYTDKSLAGAGAVAGVPCQIQSIKPITGGNRITFLWVDNNNVSHTSTLDVMDGAGGEENKIDSISVNGSPISIDENKNVDITVPSIEGLTKDTDLATVAKSGSYEDLSNKPEIPSIEGLAKTEDIPTKVSELENDSNYLSSIPEEYVTETELSAKGYLTEHQDISGKVDKVKGKSLISDTEIARLASVDNYDDTDIKAEIAKKADATAIPSKVSELTNDSNYQTAEQVNSTVTTEIAKVVADAPESLNTLKEMSDWIAGHEDDASAMNSAISDNKTAITALQTGKADKSEIPTTVAELTDSADYAKKKDLHSHTNKTVLDGITSTKVSNWDSAKTHADSAHAPSNAQANVIETVKVNGTALEVSNKAVNVTVPTTVSELTDSVDYAKKTELNNYSYLGSNATRILENDDLNNYITPGIYTCSSISIAKTLLNLPTGVDSSFRLEVIINTGDETNLYGSQEIRTNSNKNFIRTIRGTGGWTAWKELATMDDTTSSTTSTYSSDKIDKKLNGTSITVSHNDSGFLYYSIAYSDLYTESGNQGILIQHNRLNFSPSTYLFTGTNFATTETRCFITKISGNTDKIIYSTYDIDFYLDKKAGILYLKIPTYSTVSLTDLLVQSNEITATKVDAIPDTATKMTIIEYASTESLANYSIPLNINMGSNHYLAIKVKVHDMNYYFNMSDRSGNIYEGTFFSYNGSFSVQITKINNSLTKIGYTLGFRQYRVSSTEFYLVMKVSDYTYINGVINTSSALKSNIEILVNDDSTLWDKGTDIVVKELATTDTLADYTKNIKIGKTENVDANNWSANNVNYIFPEGYEGNVSNMPSWANKQGGGFLECKSWGNYVTQVFYPYSSNTNIAYMRSRYVNNGYKWTSWVKLATEDKLGGLSFSASGTTLSITDGTNTWTLEANS